MQRLTALITLTAGGLGVAGSVALGVGTLSAPQAGLWPLIVSSVVVVGSLGLLVLPVRAADHDPFTGGTRLVAMALLSLVGYALVFPLAGFTLPAFLLLVFWIRVLGKESWRLTLTVAGTAAVALFCLFALLLNVPLPLDLLWGI